ncbi:MAG: hypothetical protein HC925_07960, partial [Coleofasciculaceae cyanobacterium SM2_3_26]|nr:hypothetical protein [Coleofasciculaceae cyanobacterium SM2_3_26]
QSSDTITITDNDIPTVSIAAALAAINEGTGTTNFTITRTDTAGDLIVQFGVATETTAASTDYNLSASSFVTIPNGATSTSFTLTAGQDSPEDTFNDIVAIALLPSGIDYRVDTTSGTAQVEIIDDDASTFSVTAAPASLVENSGGTAIFTVTRIGNTTNAATVNFTTSGDATLTTDYTLSSGGQCYVQPPVSLPNPLF